MKGKYIIEYHNIKKRLLIYKNEIEQLNNKYQKDGGGSLIMEVIIGLYEKRKGGSYSCGEDDRYYYENILDLFDDECGVAIEDLTNLMNLFIERKKDKQRLGFLKGLAVREIFN